MAESPGEIPLLAALAERPLLADGAMGTELQRAGLPPGGCGESWNLDRPERVLAIQRAYEMCSRLRWSLS